MKALIVAVLIAAWIAVDVLYWKWAWTWSTHTLLFVFALSWSLSRVADALGERRR